MQLKLNKAAHIACYSLRTEKDISVGSGYLRSRLVKYKIMLIYVILIGNFIEFRLCGFEQRCLIKHVFRELGHRVKNNTIN